MWWVFTHHKYLKSITIRNNMSQNLIILRSVYKITDVYMQPAKNPATRRFPDCVRPVINGQIQLTEEDKKTGRIVIPEDYEILIQDGKTFDLDDPYQAAEWESIKYSRKIAKDRFERDAQGNLIVDGNARRYGTAELYVERPGLQSHQKNVKKRAIHEAITYIHKDAPEKLYQKAKLLGNVMTGLPVSDVEDYLVSIAEKTPHVIVEMYTGTDTHLRLLLLDALDKKIIYNRDKLFYYGESIILGASDSAVINFFKNPDNKRIFDLIKDETYPEFAIKKEKPTIDEISKEDVEKVATGNKKTSK